MSDTARGNAGHPVESCLAQRSADRALPVVLIIDGEPVAATKASECVAGETKRHRHLGMEGADA